MTSTPRYFAAPQAGDLVWVFGKGAFGKARWPVPVRLWEIDSAGRATPVVPLELKNPYQMSDAPGYAYAVPIGEHVMYNDRIYDNIDQAFQKWSLEEAS